MTDLRLTAVEVQLRLVRVAAYVVDRLAKDNSAAMSATTG